MASPVLVWHVRRAGSRLLAERRGFRLSGEQRGQENCTADIRASMQTAASRDRLQSRLRSDSTMKEAGARVQRKLFIRAIGSWGDSRLGCSAKAKPSGSRQSRRFSPLDDEVTPLNRFFARSAAPV